MSTELEMIAALTKVFKSSQSEILVGLGDDGAVVKRPIHDVVLASDMAVEGVHFNRDWSTLFEIGAKITGANLADIFAMGAQPKYLLVSAAVPKDFDSKKIEELALGIRSECDLVGVSVVGGDLSSSDKLVISISAHGEVAKPILRSGAKVGDDVIVSGLPGYSAGGLAQLMSGERDSSFIQAHKRPTINYALVKDFKSVNSMCDTSDGLLSELNHIASASAVAIEIDPQKLIEIPGFIGLNEAAENLGIDVWQWVLGGGEDHVFVATTSSDLPKGAIKIGTVKPGLGVSVEGLSNLPSAGYKHF